MKKTVKSYDIELEEKDYNFIRKNAKKLLKLALINGYEDFDAYYNDFGLSDEVKKVLPFLEEIEYIDYEEYDRIMKEVCDTISGEISPEYITFSYSDFSDYFILKDFIADRYGYAGSIIDALSENEPLLKQVVDYLLGGGGTLKNEKLDLE